MVNIYKENISRSKAGREEFVLSLIDGINVSKEQKNYLEQCLSLSGKLEVHMRERL